MKEEHKKGRRRRRIVKKTPKSAEKQEEKEDTEVALLHKERSLRTTPPAYAPSLVFSHGKTKREQTFCTLSDGCYHARSIPEMRQRRCIASCYGWLIMQSYTDLTNCCLFNPIELKTINLPPLKNNECFFRGVLTFSPTDSNCVVMFLSSHSRSLVYCRIGDDRWIEKNLGLNADELDDLSFTDLSSCQGIIYVLHREGIFVIDLEDDTNIFHARTWDCNASIPEVVFRTYFVESSREIFRVQKLYFGTSNCIVQAFDVFKLDCSTMAFTKVESIGDRIFLLSDRSSSTSFSSTELRMKGNCIYFSSYEHTSLNRFDMQDGTITTTLPCPKKINHWEEPFWVVPNYEPQVKNEAAKEYAKYDLNKDLTQEMLELILSFSHLGDCIRSRLTCKARLTITTPLRSYKSLRRSESGSQQLPWLMSFPKNNKGSCNLYHPIYNDAYIMNIPHKLAGAIVRCAKYGWLLMSQGELSIFFFNPFTMKIIQLPHQKFGYLLYFFVNISFSSPPTSSDCIVFGHGLTYKNSIKLIVYRKCKNAWSHYEFNTPYMFCPSLASPVHCDGVFYSLGKDGKLGIFNPNETKEENMWRLLPNALLPEVSSPSSSWFSVVTSFLRSFIMEYNGEILSVFIGHLGKPVRVRKLDKSKMKWVKLESLGDKVMFLSHTSSILVPAELKGVENRIYLPRFQGRDNLFYSLSTGNYHWFGSKGCEDWMNTCEHWNCNWIYI